MLCYLLERPALNYGAEVCLRFPRESDLGLRQRLNSELMKKYFVWFCRGPEDPVGSVARRLSPLPR